MTSTDIVLRFVEALDQLAIPYMLVGSYSSNLYGRPRSTNDADFVLQLTSDPLPALRKLLGPGFHIDPQMSFETVTGTMRYIATHDRTPFKVELFLLSSDAHDQSRFQSRQKVDFEGRPVWMPRPEDVIVTKLRWSKFGQRAKDVDDVRQVLRIQHGRLDLPYIRHWTDQHGTRTLFEQLLTTSQPPGHT